MVSRPIPLTWSTTGKPGWVVVRYVKYAERYIDIGSLDLYDEKKHFCGTWYAKNVNRRILRDLRIAIVNNVAGCAIGA